MPRKSITAVLEAADAAGIGWDDVKDREDWGPGQSGMRDDVYLLTIGLSCSSSVHPSLLHGCGVL